MVATGLGFFRTCEEELKSTYQNKNLNFQDMTILQARHVRICAYCSIKATLSATTKEAWCLKDLHSRPTHKGIW